MNGDGCGGVDHRAVLSCTGSLFTDEEGCQPCELRRDLVVSSGVVEHELCDVKQLLGL